MCTKFDIYVFILTSLQAANLTVIETDEFDAVGYCPFTPDHNSTAVLTKDKTYYSATVLDIQGRDEAIYRPMGNRALRTKKYNSKWLNGNFTSFFLIHILMLYHHEYSIYLMELGVNMTT